MANEISELQRRIQEDPYNPSHFQDLAEAYLDRGEEFRARDIVVKRRKMPTEDPSVMLRWGELCEDLGMARQALECYETAVRMSPDDPDALHALAALLAEVGHYEKSIRFLKRILQNDPANENAKARLADTYRALGLTGQAEVLSPTKKSEEPPSFPRYFPPAISQGDIEAMLDLFPGRETGYALHQLDPGTGEESFRIEQGPITHEMIRSHLEGEITLAVFPMRADNTMRYTALVVRPPARVVRAQLKNKGYLDFLAERSKYFAAKLAGAALRMGLPAYAEEVGDWRCRVWFFFRDFEHFLKAKRFAQEFIMKSTPPADELIVEPLMPTGPEGIGWIEKPWILPLGIHRGTLRRSFFIGSDGEHPEAQLAFLKRIRTFSLKEGLKRVRRGVRPGRSEAVVSRAVTESARMIVERCPVVREVAQKAGKGRMLSSNEKLVLFYTIGLADYDGESLFAILEPCPDFRFKKARRHFERMRKNPISCPKIRELIPEITSSVRCDCSLDLRGGKYPTPVLHADPNLVPSAEEIFVQENMDVREAARRYVRLLEQAFELKKAMSRLEDVLEKQLERKGIDRVKVGASVLVRVRASGKTSWTLERH